MTCIPLKKHWTRLPWLFTVGSIQIYIIYISINRYINLKSEVLNGHLVRFKDHQWILDLMNYYVLAIILAIGVFPLWVYSVFFSSSSFFCGSGLFINVKGFYQLVWNEALRVLYGNIHMELTGVYQRKLSPCQKTIKIAIFFPVSHLLHVFMAYLLIFPIPFIEAWLINTNDPRKEPIWSSDLDFLVSKDFIKKIKCSIEYFNFFLSLLSLTFQFPKLLYPCNKLFAIFLNSIQILLTIHILINFSMLSIFIKFYYKNLLNHDLFMTPYIVLIMTTVSDAFLLVTSVSYFQFGFEKCVQSLLMSPWFNDINRPEIIPSVNNYEHSNCQSTISSSAYYPSRNVLDIKNSVCPVIGAAALFLCGIGMKIFVCYEYWKYLKKSRYAMLYIAHSSILVLAYFMIWFGIFLKQNWKFMVTEKQLTQYSIITYPEKVGSNDYKSLRNHQDNSQTSISVVSNTNYSFNSRKKEMVPTTDCLSQNQYLTQCMSLNLPYSNKSLTGSFEYLQLKGHMNQTNAYKSLYDNNTLAGPQSPIINKLIFKDTQRTSIPTYKYNIPNSYSILRSNDSVRCIQSEELARKLKTSYPIREEINNEARISTSDDVFLDSAKSSLMYIEQLKNNSQLKFVTFQLDKKENISEDLCSSNENLTITSLDTSENFIKELDNENYTTFNIERKMNENVNSLYVLGNSSLNLPNDRNVDINL